MYEEIEKTLTISKKSWHLRVVRAVSRNYVPRNLCHYFWAVVLSCLWLPVMVVFGVPFIGFGYFFNRAKSVEFPFLTLEAEQSWNEKTRTEHFYNSLSPAAIIGILTLIVVSGVSLMPWTKEESVSVLLILLGIATMVSAIALAVILAITSFGARSFIDPPSKRSKREEKFFYKEKKTNLLWEYIKAKKKRVCPLIKVEE